MEWYGRFINNKSIRRWKNRCGRSSWKGGLVDSSRVVELEISYFDSQQLFPRDLLSYTSCYQCFLVCLASIRPA